MPSVTHGFWGFLGLSKLRDDFGPTAFRPFLLRNSIVGALKCGLTTIAAWLVAIAANLEQLGWHLCQLPKETEMSYLPAMASVTGTL